MEKMTVKKAAKAFNACRRAKKYFKHGSDFGAFYDHWMKVCEKNRNSSSNPDFTFVTEIMLNINDSDYFKFNSSLGTYAFDASQFRQDWPKEKFLKEIDKRVKKQITIDLKVKKLRTIFKQTKQKLVKAGLERSRINSSLFEAQGSLEDGLYE